MFDVAAVQRIAYDMDFYDLIIWLEEYSSAVKPPVRRTGNRQSGQEETAGQSAHCGGAAVPAVETTIPERGNRCLLLA